MLLTIVVPCYNAEPHMRRCLDSLLKADIASMEILIINDGSTDGTGAVADSYAHQCPGRVRVFHQENGGHGAGVMKGLEHAQGRFFKVVDSDDWIDPAALQWVLDRLSVQDQVKCPDIVFCQYTRHHQASGRERTTGYAPAFPTDRVFSWGEAGRLKEYQRLMMHAMFFRTELLRQCDLRLPRHTFYVDLLIADLPLLYAKTMIYWDVSPYQYLVGQAQQSVNMHNVIRNIDNMLLVISRLLERYRERQPMLEPLQDRLFLQELAFAAAIASVHLMMSRTPQAREKLKSFWQTLELEDPILYRKLRGYLTGLLASSRTPLGQGLARLVYWLVDKAYHIN